MNRGFIQEATFTYRGYKCAIIGSHLGHRCGYIEIPKDHPLHQVDHKDIDIISHGGWTYSSFAERDGYPMETSLDSWIIGFDCAHLGDSKDYELLRNLNTKEVAEKIIEIEEMFPTNDVVRTKTYVRKMLKKAVDEMKDIYHFNQMTTKDIVSRINIDFEEDIDG